AGLRPAAVGVRDLPRQPRPGRQLGGGAALPRADQPGALPGDDGAVALGAGYADAVPGPGVRLVGAVLLLRRPQAGAGGPGARRAGGVPGAVPQPGRPARPARDPRAARPGGVRALQAGPVGAPAARLGGRAAPRPVAAEARGPDVPAPGARKRGR